MKKVFRLMFTVAALATSASAIEPGNFGGLGISFYAGSNGASIVGVMPNSPAQIMGLQPGDLITSANGIEFSAIEPARQAGFLRGEAGSSINLTVERGGEKLSLSAKRVGLSVQNLEANDISAWYGKSENLTAEEISHLANQRTNGNYELLGVIQYGIPIARSAENLNANALHQISMKKAEEKQPEPKKIDGNANNLNSNGRVQGISFVNVKGARVKKQNGNEKNPLISHIE